MRARAMLAALAAAVIPAGAVAGCVSVSDREVRPTEPASPRPVAAAPRPPAICGTLRVRRTGTVRAAGATELSGLALSRRQAGVLWAHNDSGDRPRVFALRQDGTALGDVDITGAEAVDWEDMAVGPGGGPSPGDALYLADIGDNESVRSTIDVYRVSEPQVTASGPVEVAPAVRLRLRYPDGPHDAETLLVHPRSGELLIVTKQLSGESEVYAARRPAAGATTTLRRVGRLHLGLGGMATGGSVSADGRVVVVRTYGGLVAWGRRPGASLAATLRRAPCRGQTDLGGEGQGEAIALSRGGGAFFTVPEGSPAAIRRAAPRVR